MKQYVYMDKDGELSLWGKSIVRGNCESWFEYSMDINWWLMSADSPTKLKLKRIGEL